MQLKLTSVLLESSLERLLSFPFLCFFSFGFFPNFSALLSSSSSFAFSFFSLFTPSMLGFLASGPADLDFFSFSFFSLLSFFSTVAASSSVPPFSFAASFAAFFAARAAFLSSLDNPTLSLVRVLIAEGVVDFDLEALSFLSFRSDFCRFLSDSPTLDCTKTALYLEL